MASFAHGQPLDTETAEGFLSRNTYPKKRAKEDFKRGLRIFTPPFRGKEDGWKRVYLDIAKKGQGPPPYIHWMQNGYFDSDRKGYDPLKPEQNERFWVPTHAVNNPLREINYLRADELAHPKLFQATYDKLQTFANQQAIDVQNGWKGLFEYVDGHRWMRAEIARDLRYTVRLGAAARRVGELLHESSYLSERLCADYYESGIRLDEDVHDYSFYYDFIDLNRPDFDADFTDYDKEQHSMVIKMYESVRRFVEGKKSSLIKILTKSPNYTETVRLTVANSKKKPAKHPGKLFNRDSAFWVSPDEAGSQPNHRPKDQLKEVSTELLALTVTKGMFARLIRHRHGLLEGVGGELPTLADWWRGERTPAMQRVATAAAVREKERGILRDLINALDNGVSTLIAQETFANTPEQNEELNTAAQAARLKLLSEFNVRTNKWSKQELDSDKPLRWLKIQLLNLEPDLRKEGGPKQQELRKEGGPKQQRTPVSFNDLLARHGLTEIDCGALGNCQFEVWARYLHMDAGTVRQRAMEHMAENPLGVYDEDFHEDGAMQEYIRDMSEVGEWGDEHSLVAIARTFQCNFTLFQEIGGRLAFHTYKFNEEWGDPTTVLIGYKNGNHYVLVADANYKADDAYFTRKHEVIASRWHP